MDVMKAAMLGAILTWTISIIVGSQGSSGGQLAIHHMQAGDYRIYWSWPLFLSASGITWCLLLIQR